MIIFLVLEIIDEDPQISVHIPFQSVQFPTSQLIGIIHDCVLQSLDSNLVGSSADGQIPPPCEGTIIFLVLLVLPDPVPSSQVLVQTLQSDQFPKN